MSLEDLLPMSSDHTPLPQKIAVKKLNSSSSSSNKISEKAIKKINELYETDFNTFEYEMR